MNFISENMLKYDRFIYQRFSVKHRISRTLNLVSVGVEIGDDYDKILLERETTNQDPILK